MQHGTDAVISAIKRIGQVTEETATGANRVSDSVLGQANEIARLSESAAMLTELAGNLHQAVGQFRVDDETAGAASPIQLRKNPRYRVNFGVTYTIDGRSAVTAGKARDFGGGGICFESNEPLEQNVPMTIWFDLRNEKLKVRGRTVAPDAEENSPHAHRIEFFDLSDTVRDAILTFIREARRDALIARGAEPALA